MSFFLPITTVLLVFITITAPVVIETSPPETPPESTTEVVETTAVTDAETTTQGVTMIVTVGMAADRA